MNIKNHMTAAAAMIFAAALLFVSCGKEAPQQGGNDDVQSLGTYEFDGDVYNILSASFSETSSYYTFIFSPIPSDEVITTYLYLSIRTYWGDGQEHEVGGLDLDHNDDYLIVYEDPVHFYSAWREPLGGSFCVTVPEDGTSDFHVALDVQLADGTPVKLDYVGPMTSPSTEG